MVGLAPRQRCSLRTEQLMLAVQCAVTDGHEAYSGIDLTIKLLQIWPADVGPLAGKARLIPRQDLQ